MKTATRLAFFGLGALALLSAVHWARAQHFDGPPLMLYLLGVLPNFCAAIAIPYVLLSVWMDRAVPLAHTEVRKRFLALTLFAGVGLIFWEFGQQSSRALFFDPDDLVATVVGLVVGWTIFGLISREDR